MLKLTRWMMWVVCVMGMQAGPLQAEEAQQPGDPMQLMKQAITESVIQQGSPGEAHKALELFAGNWNYVMQYWMAPEAQPGSASGTSTINLMLGGRFLKHEVKGPSMVEGQPPFEGVGFIGYDNLRKEYQTVWMDNMMTGMMRGSGSYDAASKALLEQGDFSCPATGESHHGYRSTWKVVDADHLLSETYFKTPEGKEFKSMEIRYTRSS